MSAGRYRTRAFDVVASRWFANGDHPDDGVGQTEPDPVSGGTYERVEGRVVRYFRHPYVPGDRTCGACGLDMARHGWIDTPPDGHVVCPGNWVVTDPSGALRPVPHDLFKAVFEVVS